MGRTLLDRLLGLYPDAKRAELDKWVKGGRVTIGGKPARSLTAKVEERERVEVLAGGPGEYEIVFEDEDVVVVNKPSGLLTSTVPREPRPTLLAMVRERIRSADPKAVVGLIHRLDRDASGALVFSKNPMAYASLKKQLLERKMGRVYMAIVVGKPANPKGKMDSRLKELPSGVVKSVRSLDQGERAVTEYQVISTHGELSLLRVTLLTGKKHQIRVHMSEKKMPILGDEMYGGPKAQRLMLHATQLTFTHPRTGVEMKFELPLPKEFKTAIKSG